MRSTSFRVWNGYGMSSPEPRTATVGPTTITYLNRDDDVTFRGTAEWERPRVPPNEFLPTEKCSVRLVATLAANGIAVSNDGFLCY